MVFTLGREKEVGLSAHRRLKFDAVVRALSTADSRLNQIHNEAWVFTYQDTAVVNPNSHTPYPAGQSPPVNAFWSVTRYDGKSQLLLNNPLNRYLINSQVLFNMSRNPGCSLTLYRQRDNPGALNWCGTECQFRRKESGL